MKKLTHTDTDCTDLIKKEYRGITAELCAGFSFILLVLLVLFVHWHRKRSNQEEPGVGHQDTGDGENLVNDRGGHEKAKKKRYQLYCFLVLLSTFLYLVVLTVGGLSKYKDGACQAVGYFDQALGLVQICITLWVSYFISNDITIELLDNHNPEPERRRKAREGVFIVITIILCFAIAAILFHGDHYGKTGPWCWIKDANCKPDSNSISFDMQLFLWYFPNALVSIMSTTIIVLSANALCIKLRGTTAEDDRNKYIAKIIAILLFVLFQLVLLVLTVTEYVSRVVVGTNNDTPVFWRVYAILNPASAFLLGIFFCVYLQFGEYIGERAVGCYRKWELRSYRYRELTTVPDDISDSGRLETSIYESSDNVPLPINDDD